MRSLATAMCGFRLVSFEFIIVLKIDDSLRGIMGGYTDEKWSFFSISPYIEIGDGVR
jgi:hypothetical protein